MQKEMQCIMLSVQGINGTLGKVREMRFQSKEGCQEPTPALQQDHAPAWTRFKL